MNFIIKNLGVAHATDPFEGQTKLVLSDKLLSDCFVNKLLSDYFVKTVLYSFE